jgi:uncharacterized membrane protein
MPPTIAPLRGQSRADVAICIEKGAAAGAMGGLVASAAMDGFQALAAPLLRIGSNGVPATEQAADRVAVLVSRARLSEADRQAGGTGVHYVVGMLTGAAYGAFVEARPGYTAGQGLLLGLGSALVIDQLAVPLLGLARPPWRYTVRTHVYALASHAVFGLVVETVRRVLRKPAGYAALPEGAQITREDVALPLLLGLVNGQRTFAAPAAISIAAASAGLGLKSTPLVPLASKWTGALMTAAAIGELVMDKQPGIPARISPPGLAARAIGGAVSASASARPGKAVLSAALGAAGALAGGYISYRFRMGLARALGRDRPVAFAEDAIAIVGSAALAGYAALRQNQREAGVAQFAADR